MPSDALFGLPDQCMIKVESAQLENTMQSNLKHRKILSKFKIK